MTFELFSFHYSYCYWVTFVHKFKGKFSSRKNNEEHFISKMNMEMFIIYRRVYLFYVSVLYVLVLVSCDTSKIEIRWNVTQNYYGYYFIKLRPYPSFMRLTSKFTHSQTWQRLFHCQHRSVMSGVDIMGWHNGSLPWRVKTPRALKLSGSA